jgi:hypothetical protein
MSKYEIIIYWSEEDQSFIAEVPELAAVWLTVQLIRKRWQMWRLSFRNGLKRRAIWADKFQNQKEDWFLLNYGDDYEEKTFHFTVSFSSIVPSLTHLLNAGRY